MADLGLPDPVDASEALLDPVGVPGEVVVDHEVCALQVEPFPRRVGRYENSGLGILGEPLLGDPPLLAGVSAVDRYHDLRTAEISDDPIDQVVEGVPVLREDDDLAGVAIAILGYLFTVEDVAQLGPLAIRS